MKSTFPLRCSKFLFLWDQLSLKFLVEDLEPDLALKWQKYFTVRSITSANRNPVVEDSIYDQKKIQKES